MRTALPATRILSSARIWAPAIPSASTSTRRSSAPLLTGRSTARTAIPASQGTLVHYCEAILATLAILVWHFYHVIFDPDVYPMSGAWLDGKMSEEHFKEEHAKEYEKTAGTSGIEGKES
jgi:hypothetical protein